MLNTFREELTQTLREAAERVTTPESREDLHTLQQLLLQRREPRIALVGDAEVSLHDVFAALGVAPCSEVAAQLGVGRWYAHELERGVLHVADLRGDAQLQSLAYHPADAIVAVVASGTEDATDAVARLHDAMELALDHHDAAPAALIAVFRPDGARTADDFATVLGVRAAFVERDLPRDWVDIECVARFGDAKRTLAAPLTSQLSMPVSFALARLTADRGAQRAVAYDLAKFASTLNGAIATVPIPASAIPITSVQIGMITGIAIVSGRPLRLRTVTEFGAAVGLNLGAAVALREVARTLIAWIPVAGPAISASIAAGATMTLGRAAMRHYLG